MPLPGGDVLYTSNCVYAPDDIFRVNAKGKVSQLTNVNRDLLAELDPVKLDKFSFTGANGDKVWGMKLKPSGPRYAARPSCRSPSSSMAGRRAASATAGHTAGTRGYSPRPATAWSASISTGRPVTARPSPTRSATIGAAGRWRTCRRVSHSPPPKDAQLDADQACALGASYGGYMMNWIAGQWPDRFKCLVQHDGVFDARAMAYETEELWFDEWEHGGKAYYEDPAAFEKWNPVNYVQNWKTPMLVITGEKDFRIPYTQGLAAFTALQRRNIPSRLARQFRTKTIGC